MMAASCTTKKSLPPGIVYEGPGHIVGRMNSKRNQHYLWIRFAAVAVDCLCALAVMAGVGVGAGRATSESSVTPAVVLLTAVAVSLVEVVTDRSPGKWLMGLRIRRPDGSNSAVGARF